MQNYLTMGKNSQKWRKNCKTTVKLKENVEKRKNVKNVF